MNHTIVHFEIPADNVDKMKRFYVNVFGWKTVDIPQMEYIMFHTVPTDEKGMLKEPGLNGGLYKRTSKEQVPVNYVNVESVDDYIERAIKNGGKLLAPKMHIPTVGDTAWITDPEGNPLGLIRPEM
jgi:predicted enzyme related to lactoylglutathione lyase